MNIVYTEHLKLRLKLRKIPEEYPEIILKSPDHSFFDTIEKKNISVKRLIYHNKLRNVMIAYEDENNHVEIVTIHPITDNQIINRIKSRRWLKNEKI